jgi:branched-chain amino acid transport system permease protein
MASNMATDAAVAAPQQTRSRKLIGTEKVQLWAGIALVVGTGLIPEIAGSSYWTHIFQLINIFVIASVAQNLLYADAGQASFGQGAIFGLAGYAVAISVGMHNQSYAVGVFLGLLAALGGSVLFALPALRVQYFYLGFVTMSGAFVLPELALAFNNFTNGLIGISMNFDYMHKPVVFGVFSPLSLACSGLAALSLVAHLYLRRSLLGRRMRVAALSVEAAQALGINTGLMRAAAFLLAGLATGIAGVLYPPIVGFVSPSSFNLEMSILFFFAVIVGGKGAVLGPVLGLWVLYVLPNVLLAEYVNIRLLAYGVAALAVMLAFPDGIVGAYERWAQRRRAKGERIDLHVGSILGKSDAPAAKLERTQVAVEVKKGLKTFGHVVAVDRVDLTVLKGEIHGLVGANGSGKTSLLNVLSGFSRLDSGSLHVNSADITHLAPHRIAQLGVGRTFQTPRIFGTMSLWENVEIGRDAARLGAAQTIPPERIELLRRILGDGSPEWVPHGQRRLVEVLRVVLQESEILLLDEPAAGLSPEERREFGALLRTLRDQYGKTVILVEHDLDLVWGVADRITVLEAGKVVASGQPADVARDPAVQHLFVHAKNA